MLYLH